MVLSAVETFPMVRTRPSHGEQMEVLSFLSVIGRAVGLSVLVKKSVNVVYYSKRSRWASSILTP